jgi:hypothetical protein
MVSFDSAMPHFPDRLNAGVPPNPRQPHRDGLKPFGFQRFGAPQCEVCGQPLSVHEQATGKTCSQASCKERSLRVAAQKQLEDRAALQSTALACRDEVTRAHAIESPERLGLAILPSNERALTNTPAKSIRAFRDGLMQKISRAAERHYGEYEPPATHNEWTAYPELDQRQLAILGNACATCRGDCCPQGAGHAFIHVETILGYMQNHPDQRPIEILQEYMDRIPSKSYQGSCVYHTRGGCALPRQMRSHICNGFLCKGLGEVLEQLNERDDCQVFVVAMDGGKVTRSAIIEQHRRTLYDASGQLLE